MVDIFNEGKESSVANWAKFQNPGDAYQGTYIGKILNVKDGYGNEQIVYELQLEDGSVVNVGFGLNKKMIHRDMERVKFGQIIGFKFKGMLSVKDKFGKPVNVKDISLFQDPKIVNTQWINENGDTNRVTVAPTVDDSQKSSSLDVFDEDYKEEGTGIPDDDVPFSSESSLTNEDKLAVIAKLAKDKLGANSSEEVKSKVMEKTAIAFIPVNYDKIIEALKDIF